MSAVCEARRAPRPEDLHRHGRRVRAVARQAAAGRQQALPCFCFVLNIGYADGVQLRGFRGYGVGPRPAEVLFWPTQSHPCPGAHWPAGEVADQQPHTGRGLIGRLSPPRPGLPPMVRSHSCSGSRCRGDHRRCHLSRCEGTASRRCAWHHSGMSPGFRPVVSGRPERHEGACMAGALAGCRPEGFGIHPQLQHLAHAGIRDRQYPSGEGRGGISRDCRAPWRSSREGFQRRMG